MSPQFRVTASVLCIVALAGACPDLEGEDDHDSALADDDDAVEDDALLFGVSESSNLEAGEVHILGALGDEDTEPVEQDLCQPSPPFTAGADGIEGTSDDQVGEFSNPAVNLRAFGYDLLSNGAIIPLRDVRLTFGFTPDGQGLERGRLRATMDTRPISRDILNNEDPFATCTLIFKASGRDCFDCGGDDPGNFCINLEIAGLTGTGEGDGLVERRCETIIQEALDDVACDGKASRFERKGEEGYPLCTAFTGAT